MLESRDFVISPDVAYSPELLHAFLLAELGANLLNNSQYRIEKISLDIKKLILKNKWADKGDKIVVTSGSPFGAPGSTNSIFIIEI